MKLFKKVVYSFLFITIIFIVSIFIFSCQRKKTEYSQAEFVLGTVCQIRLLSDKPKKQIEKVYNEIFAELKRLDSIFNANTGQICSDAGQTNNDDSVEQSIIPKTSELEKLNSGAGIKEIEISEELFELLKISLFFAHKTNGAFNPAIGKLVKLWDIGFLGQKPPLKSDIDSILNFIDYKDIALKKIDPKNSKAENKVQYIAFLKKQGMRLDLGGIAKGYATDKVVEIIRKFGIEDSLVDIGGNLFALGHNMKGLEWSIGLRDPHIGSNAIAMSLKLSQKSIVTSGNYERFFEHNGKIYHHILDLKTGYPIENNLNAVSVIANSSVYADAISTACFALGFENSKDLIEEINNSKKDEIAAFFFFKDNSVKTLGSDEVQFSISNGIRLD